MSGKPYHRGQIVFREATGSTRSVHGYGSVEKRPGMDYYLGIGCIETDIGALPDEAVLGCTFGERRDGCALSLGAPQPQEENLLLCDVNSILTTMKVRSPEGFGGLLSHGGLHLRRTRFPTAEGRETMAVAGVFRSGPDLPQRVMFEMEGHGSDLMLRPSRPFPEAFPVGSVMSTTMDMPVWGFGPEPRSFHSTLALGVIDDMKAFIALKDVEFPDAEERERMRDLERTIGGGIVSHRFRINELRGGDFMRWREIGRELGNPVEIPPDSYLTREESERHKAAAGEAMRALFEEKAQADTSPRV